MRLASFVSFALVVTACGGSTATVGDGTPGGSSSNHTPAPPAPTGSPCYDCGPCGIAGPVDADYLAITTAGTKDGFVEVGLVLAKAGECVGSSTRDATLTLGKDGITVTDGRPKLDVVAKNDGRAYTFPDRDLEMKVEAASSGGGIVLVLSALATDPAARSITCSPSGEKTTCVER